MDPAGKPAPDGTLPIEPISIEMPRGDLPPLSQLFNPEHASFVILGTVGDLLWIVAYVLIIIIGFRQRTYGIPMLAICLNVTWEFVYTIVHPPPTKMTWALHFAWFVIDLLIVYQLLRFGRPHQTIPDVRRNFRWVVAGTIVACAVGHLTFHDFQTHLALFPDRQGITSAFVINVVMSILFVRMYFHRKDDLIGLSYPAAWSKMLGTGLISLANVLVYFKGTSQTFHLRFRPVDSQEWYDGPTIGGATYHPGFTFYLFFLILFFDVLFVILLHRRRNQLAAEQQGQQGQQGQQAKPAIA